MWRCKGVACRALLYAALLLLLLSTCGEGAKHSKEPAKDGIDSLTLVLEHAIGAGGEFVEKAVASVRSLKTSSMTMALSQSQLSHSQLEEIKAVASEGGVVRVRAPRRLREGLTETGSEEQQHFVSTTISACSLVKSGLSDIIKVTGDGRGNVVGLAVTTPPTLHTADCTSPDVLLPRSFNTSVTLDNGSPPPSPDVQVFLQKKEREEKEKRDGKDDRSFLQKYWIYIVVGVFLLMTLNSAGGGGSG